MNPARKWRKFLIVGCSHGHLADRLALRKILEFKAAFKPWLTVHLGDFFDLAALRSGARGSKDEGADIDHDLKSGFNFIEQLEPNILFMGNHDDRIERLQDHPKAIVAYCAGKIMGEVGDFCQKFKVDLVPYGISKGWRPLGNYLMGHGYMFNEMAIRDHAETVGNCIIAHLHRTGEERGRRLGGATGYCVGSLADIPAMEYAKIKRATLKWNLGFAWGEYCHNAAAIHLCARADNGYWRLPL